MKINKQVKLSALVVVLASFGASAQTVNGTATSANEVQSTSAAQNQGNTQGITFNSEERGSTTLRNTPGTILGGFSGSFSSDFCRGSSQAGISGPGFSIAGGGQVTDDACVLYRGVERTMQVSSTLRGFNPATSAKLDQAAVDMLCSVPQLAPAMRNQGICTLPEEQRRATVSQNSIYSGGQ